MIRRDEWRSPVAEPILFKGLVVILAIVALAVIAFAAAALAQDLGGTVVVGNSATTSAAIADFTACTPGAFGCGQQVADVFCQIAQWAVPILGTSSFFSIVANFESKLPPAVRVFVHVMALNFWRALQQMQAQQQTNPAPTSNGGAKQP